MKAGTIDQARSWFLQPTLNFITVCHYAGYDPAILNIRWESNKETREKENAKICEVCKVMDLLRCLMNKPRRTMGWLSFCNNQGEVEVYDEEQDWKYNWKFIKQKKFTIRM